MLSADGRKMHSTPKPRFDISRTTGRWPSILASLGVGKRALSGNNGPCPFCEGTDRFRFTDKDGAGVWICNKCGTGNGFHFVERWENTNFVGACKAIERVLPQSTLVREKKPMDHRAKLNGIWKMAHSIEALDPVSTYLTARGLNVPDTLELRCIEKLAYWHEKRITTFPSAMVARVRGGDGKPATLHVTYLNGDGTKADVPTAKKVLSSMPEGSHIRLTNSYSNVLCLTEGIETGLAVLQMTGLPTWAMISAGGLVRFVLPEGVDTVNIYGDNDLGFAGQSHAYTLAYRLSNAGVNVSVLIPNDAGQDWADVLKSQLDFGGTL